MVHVRALPGSPRWAGDIGAVEHQAVDEARALAAAGFTAIVLENMHDRPYLPRAAGAPAVAALARVATAVRAAVPGLPMGVQLLAGDNEGALSIALAAGLDFIRVEGFVFGHVADEGWLQSDAGTLLRLRRALGAEQVAILADIKKKHSAHAVTADVSLAETADAARFFLADGVIVTGTSTGKAASPRDTVEAASGAGPLPVWVGSGTTPDNMREHPRVAGFIVGSYIKQGGHWDAPLDLDRCRALAAAFNALPPLR